jgi:hypothetical protein
MYVPVCRSGVDLGQQSGLLSHESRPQSNGGRLPGPGTLLDSTILFSIP